ncbi:MAG: site-specific tyrosine recombinase [Candidatus Scalindua rubra]|uniref:Site-specific tyrosine recombinase n=1 Tax=Candidatus Scalindua rubra TaxID=1872076 RepID=A0A1E3XC48_9BACT|nr:MAG: site-specific tyrosine recombinase [Candidatus Scalindua rubra]
MKNRLLSVQNDNLPTLTHNWSKMVNVFLLSQDVRKTSKNTYQRGLRQFLTWFEQKAIKNPVREDILDYKAYLADQELSSLTVSNYMVVVRKFFEWMEGMKYYPNIAKGIKGMKRVKGFRKDPLTVSQIKELLNSIDRTTIQGKRDFAMLNLLVRTGLRTIEVVRANIDDIRQEGGEAVLWIQGKGRDTKDDFVMLTPATLNPIREYLSARKAKDTYPLFTSLSDRNTDERITTRSVSWIVKEHLRGIGLDDSRLTAHSLRHTSITLALQGGATIQEAQALGRHSDINTTLVYAHNINRIKHAAERNIDDVLSGQV